jgi:hypothetical protein
MNVKWPLWTTCVGAVQVDSVVTSAVYRGRIGFLRHGEVIEHVKVDRAGSLHEPRLILAISQTSVQQDVGYPTCTAFLCC